MPTKEEMLAWIPKYISTVSALPDGHVVTAEEWNAAWNLQINQGDWTALAVRNVIDLIFDTVMDGATNDSLDVRYNTKAQITSLLAGITALINEHVAVIDTRNDVDEAALSAHRVGEDHDVRYYTKVQVDSKIQDTENSANDLEVIVGDALAKITANSAGIEFLTANGSGGWDKAFYFDPLTGKFILNATLSAQMIEAYQGVFGSVITNNLITNNLYANKGYIAELTVDQLDTSDKIRNYLNNDTSDVNYVMIKDQQVQFITAQYTSGYAQLRDRNNDLVYWLDASHTGVTTDATDLPVYIYNYTDHVKVTWEFYNNGTDYIQRIVLGVGSGVGGNGKGYIYKIDGGLQLTYLAYGGSERTIKLHEDGIKVVGNQSNGGIVNVYPYGVTITNPQHGDLRVVLKTP